MSNTPHSAHLLKVNVPPWRERERERERGDRPRQHRSYKILSGATSALDDDDDDDKKNKKKKQLAILWRSRLCCMCVGESALSTGRTRLFVWWCTGAFGDQPWPGNWGCRPWGLSCTEWRHGAHRSHRRAPACPMFCNRATFYYDTYLGWEGGYIYEAPGI